VRIVISGEPSPQLRVQGMQPFESATPWPENGATLTW
jgi:hypothetical protein